MFLFHFYNEMPLYYLEQGSMANISRFTTSNNLVSIIVMTLHWHTDLKKATLPIWYMCLPFSLLLHRWYYTNTSTDALNCRGWGHRGRGESLKTIFFEIICYCQENFFISECIFSSKKKWIHEHVQLILCTSVSRESLVCTWFSKQ